MSTNGVPLPGAEIDQIERDIQSSGHFHHLIRVVVHGPLIQCVHFVCLGLSSCERWLKSALFCRHVGGRRRLTAAADFPEGQGPAP
jgi:hypothetical protein